ncbi:hypothetical protein DCAR_0312385 [Daucus carota subsp. sativus]|uniref:SAP domain-containing protein n=1 Tax=Daucus carota subsp. sativus TaxID=79200 RepID=A0AAF1ARU7_DAUCS|nr:hypothetical protein DCAR_0312385 [Daucus carota subsp. sativus]
MCDTRGKKRAFITISSDKDDDDCDKDVENVFVNIDDDDVDDEIFVENEVNDNNENVNIDVDLDDQLEELNLFECKTYLRKLKLRLSGTKAECINRIKEYWRIKDGNGEALYPRSSFDINCTGDVCKGDIVLFTQKVYQKFDKMRRSGNILGKRTIAGRITKESYGAAKQQHTFTVEVFWSKGIKKLAPLSPLLVKGRNLYKMRTYRRCWKNESERLVVLAEKHKRGAAAREVRARKKLKRSSTKASENCQKAFNYQLSQTSQSIDADKTRGVRQHQYTQLRNVMENDHHKNSLSIGRRESNQLNQSRKCEPVRRHQNFNHHNKVRDPIYQSYTTSSRDYYHTRTEYERQRAHLGYPFERTHTRLPHSRPYGDDHTFTVVEHQRNNNGTYPHYTDPNPNYDLGARSSSRLPDSMNTFRPSHPLPYRTYAYVHGRRGT